MKLNIPPDDTLSPPKGYKQTSIGIIPEDWEVTEAKDVLDFFPTASYSRAELDDSGDCNYLHYGDIHTKRRYTYKVQFPLKY